MCLLFVFDRKTKNRCKLINYKIKKETLISVLHLYGIADIDLIESIIGNHSCHVPEYWLLAFVQCCK